MYNASRFSYGAETCKIAQFGGFFNLPLTFQLTIGCGNTDQQGTELTHVPHLSTGALGKVILPEETLLENFPSSPRPLDATETGTWCELKTLLV